MKTKKEILKDKDNLICCECGGKLIKCKCGEFVSTTLSFCYACGEDLKVLSVPEKAVQTGEKEK